MGEFEDIYSTYFSDVYRYSRSLTMDDNLAEEITQETFFRALRSLGSFRGDCELRVWLCRIAKNLWMSEKKNLRRFTDKENVLDDTAQEHDFTAALADRQFALQLHRILHEIEEPYKEIFSLRVFGELSFKDIGDLFTKSEHWACVTFHRAKDKIQKKIGGRV